MEFCNRKLDSAFEFIAQSDFDIFCLQEVPEKFLERLKTLSCSIAFCTDADIVSAKNTKRIFLVILSAYPITGESEIAFPDYVSSLRSRLFTFLMRPFNISGIKNHHSFFVDVELPEGRMRVYNLHLILASQPTWRLKEFEETMTQCNTACPNIVCGDFNTLETPYIAPLNWIFGGRMTDALFCHRERIHIEKCFTAHALINALRGMVTHPLSHSQLDHILVSNSFSIKNAEVIPNRFGSDHHPIRMEIC